MESLYENQNGSTELFRDGKLSDCHIHISAPNSSFIYIQCVCVQHCFYHAFSFFTSLDVGKNVRKPENEFTFSAIPSQNRHFLAFEFHFSILQHIEYQNNACMISFHRYSSKRVYDSVNDSNNNIETSRFFLSRLLFLSVRTYADEYRSKKHNKFASLSAKATEC